MFLQTWKGDLLVLQDDDWVGVADSSLQQTLGIFGAVWGDDLQSWNTAIPGGEVLRVLSSDTGGETVRATEGDVAGLDTTGHVVCLCGRVDDLVNGLHGEIEGHELALIEVRLVVVVVVVASTWQGIVRSHSQWDADQRAQRQR